MKHETLIRKIAEKVGSPELLEVLEGKRSVDDLPDSCMVWTGAQNHSGNMLAKDRDAQNIPVMYQVYRRPMGIIKTAGKIHYVHRLVYTMIFYPEFEFRMSNRCGNPLCCHPRHWDVDMPTPEFDSGDHTWRQEEAMEAVEAMLARASICSWADVQANPWMEGIPEDLVRKCLILLHKEHLLR